MKRYYLSDIIGDGTEDNPFRPAVADLGVAWVGSIPSDPVTGRPTSTYALVLVDAQNHTALQNDVRIDPLPDFPLDGKVNGINVATLAKTSAALSRRKIPTTLINGADGYRDVIRGIGRRLDAAFNENNFDVNA